MRRAETVTLAAPFNAEQSKPHYLSFCQLCSSSRLSNRDHQTVSSLAEEQTQLIGDKSTATETLCFETELEVLDPMFTVTSALNIEVVIQFLPR
jgi:hypothetical protein